MKQLISRLIRYLPFNITKNQEYDRQTIQVIKRVCKPTSNCIDIGCHKGEILDIMLNYAPNGKHFGFEPIPDMYKKLTEKYTPKCTILPFALSETKGKTTFNYVISNPAYSGIRKRNYDKPNEKETLIEVETELLDNIIPANTKIDFIKIDVEGAELQVLKGAVNTLKNSKPIIIFEHGLGASDCYGTTPKDIFSLLTSVGYKISTMKKWLKNEKEFTLEELESEFNNKINYYFIAY